MNRSIKIVSYAFASLVCLLLIGGIALQLVFGSYLKELVVKSINERLDAPLLVKGEIEFSVFRSFPYISVDFNKIELKEGIKGSTKSLLVADKISLQFNITSVLAGNYNIKRVKISNGKLSTSIDENGNGNYFVFKKSTSTTTDEASIRIEDIILSNVGILHNDIFNHQSYSLTVNSGKASGDFSAVRFNTQTDATLLIHDINIDGTHYFVEKPATLDLGLDIDLENELYKFKNCRLAVSEAAFRMTGDLSHSKKGYKFDLFLNGEDLGLEELGSLLPAEYYKPIKDWDTKGDLTCTGTIKGLLSSKSNPAVEFRLGVKNATINHDGETIRDVNLSAVYSNGNDHKWKSSKLTVTDAKLKFNDQPFECSFDLSRFDYPYLNLKVNGLVDLASLKPFLELGDDVTLTGQLQLINFNYHGAAQAISSKNAVATQSTGTVMLKDVNYNGNGVNIKSLNSTIVSDGNELQIQQCSLLSGKSNLALNGNIQNLIPTLLTGIHSKAAAILFNFNLQSENFDVADFAFTGSPSTDSLHRNNNRDPWYTNVSGHVACNINNFRYDKFTAQNLATNLHTQNGLVRFNDLHFAALQGSATANGTFDARQKNLQVLESTFTCSGIDVNQLFREFDNFSQTDFTSENIAGALNTKCYLKLVWRNGEFSTNDLVAIADMTIDKGELNRFKPMHALSKFAKVDDLDNIRFSRLSNQIEIRNGLINIPTTIIRSNVMSVELSGTHTLDNYINYKLKLNLSEMIGNKFRRVSTFDPEATDTEVNGTLNLYITMKGPAGNPTITYDKQSVKKVVQENIAQERKDLKDVLKQEFTKSEYKQQEVKDWKAPDEYELIDFDANNSDNSQ